MKEWMNHLIEEKRYFLITTGMFLFFFVIALVQNIIRYGIHETYNPWNSVLYLIFSLLLFLPILPFLFIAFLVVQKNRREFYWWWAIGISIIAIGIHYLISSILIHFCGFYDDYFSANYARQYFGREALFHVIIVGVTLFYVYYLRMKPGIKMISGMIGRKEIILKSDEINWIETDDHYLKIYAKQATLIKRYTMDKIAEELKPDFIRIHRKYLVNKARIVGTQKVKREEFVLLDSGEKLKIGRSFKPLPL